MRPKWQTTDASPLHGERVRLPDVRWLTYSIARWLNARWTAHL